MNTDDEEAGVCTDVRTHPGQNVYLPPHPPSLPEFICVYLCSSVAPRQYPVSPM
jgi:hypothetical protein